MDEGTERIRRVHANAGEVDDHPGEKPCSVPGPAECPVCYNAYDNVFRAPKLLDCAHAFCLECLSRLMLLSQTARLPCPVCRHITALPADGPPALTTSGGVLRALPPHQQQEQRVWLDGGMLRCQSPGPGGHSCHLTVCVDIGAGKGVDASIQTSPGDYAGAARLLRCNNKGFCVVLGLFVFVVLWSFILMYLCIRSERRALV